MFGLSRYVAITLALLFSAFAVGFVLNASSGADQRSPTDGGGPVTAELIEDLIAFAEEEAFDRLSGPWQLSLPEDHGGHPEARAETWMITAHLSDESGVPVGMTFSLSRFGLLAGPPEADGSPWDLRALYRAHTTLAHDEASGTRGEERFSRGAGTAGHDNRAQEVWLDDWQMTYGDAPDGKGLTLQASVHDTAIRLVLEAVKAAEPSGAGDEAPVRGFAIPRLTVTGQIGSGDNASRVYGVAWMDRFWGELPTPGGPLTYDRLILQLEDGSDVSLLRSQRRDGRGGATVDGLIVSPAGDSATLSEDALRMTATDYWTPGGVGASYPIAWRVEGAGLDLEVTPLTEKQMEPFVLPSWNGFVSVSGHLDGARITGLGTLELTGYEEP